MNLYIALFFSGAIGALAREAFRWRKLYLSGRIAKYTQPLYIGIALAIVFLAGCVSLIFSPLLPTLHSQLPAAFVVGAGFELLVQQATRLRMPRIPMGADTTTVEEEASIDEFLRQ